MQTEKILSIAFPVTFILFFSLAVMNYPSYDPFRNYLSDLGVGQNSAIFFNTGAILTGLVGAIFSYFVIQGQNEKKTNKVFTLVKLFFLLANISLMGVGIFPENNELHSLVSGAFFILYAIACPILSYDKETATRLFGFGVSLFAVGFIILESFVIPITIPVTLVEHIAVLMIGVWAVVFGTNHHQISNQYPLKR